MVILFGEVFLLNVMFNFEKVLIDLVIFWVGIKFFIMVFFKLVRIEFRIEGKK